MVKENLKRLLRLGERKKEERKGESEEKAGESEEEIELQVQEAIEEDEKKEIERYAVNEPYAYIRIIETSPPLYEVLEPKLSRGEKELLKEIKNRLYETIAVSFAGVTEPDEFLREKVEALFKDLSVELSPERMDKLMYYVRRDFIGYGKFDPITRDKMAEDISADGPGIPLYVYHRKYGSIETNIRFEKAELDAMIYKLAQRAGRHISMAKPLLDASLPNKDRLQLSIGSEVDERLNFYHKEV